MSTEPIIINVESVCRSCLNDDTEMASLFDTDGTEELRIVDMLESCAFLNVNSNDGFPTQICLQCYTFIHQAYQFKLQCQKSESIIRSFLDARQTQVIKIEEECISSKNDYGEGETTGQYTSYCDDTDVSKMELIEPMEETVGAYDPEQILTCSDCEERFTSTEALDNHKLIFHDKNEYSCPRCLKKFKQSDLLTVHMRHCETHECEICKKKFRTLGYLQNHMKRHDPDYVASDKRYYCTECDKSYTSPANLAIHQYSHSGIKPFKCEFCGKGFTKAISLNSHKALHTGKKPHICDICERGFTSATILTQHKKIHSGEKPYKCTECERSFTASGDLTIHMRSHTGERPYLCTTCGRSFARITHLNTHIRTHTGEKPYVCSTCNRGFAQSGDLRSHLRTHTGERPFSCKVCNKRFVQSSGLSSHMATHSNEKAYVCDVCNRAFSQSASLTRHAKAHIVMS